MLRNRGLLLILLPLASLALVAAQPVLPQAAAQSRDARPRGEGDAGPRGNGEGRRGDREGRGGRRNGGRGRDGGEERPTDSGGPPTSTATPRPAASTGGGPTTEDYVRELIRKHDKNGDTMLQADEQSGLKGKPAESDQSKDGVITFDEMVATLKGAAPAPAAAATGSGDSKISGDRREGKAGATATTRVYTALTGKDGKDATKDAAVNRRTYRFTPAAEKLPATGLPSWFKTRDANGDGQVAMSEYSRSWSKRTVDEFVRYDLNGDGVVTAREAAGK